MISTAQQLCESYVFCVEKGYKDGFYFEAKARDIVSGRFYDVRFSGRKNFFFFVFSSGRWDVYFMNTDEAYHPSVFCGAGDFLRLENDIITRKETPLIHIKSGKKRSCFLRKGGRIELPEFPFFYQAELARLDSETEKSRYKYQEAPKYLIIGRSSKYVKPDSVESFYVFGCNKESVYNSIFEGSSIEVTATNRNALAVAVGKTENSFDIVPMQHCLRLI